MSTNLYLLQSLSISENIVVAILEGDFDTSAGFQVQLDALILAYFTGNRW